MTIIVGYTESEPSRAALDFGLDLAEKLSMSVVVVNAGPGAERRSESELTQAQTEQLEQYLARFSVPTELRKYSRGRSTTDEFKDVVAELHPYAVIIGTAKRTGFSKFMMGSVADELLRELPVPVVSVKVPETAVTKQAKHEED
ncbi:universal stress protein [Enteractinococcus coprophilus]|uniref:Nucleotide-binding universal stress UspA family protein n=1 Tax=Enteractinococcus coprophilus TaxID=1027633 RepID=A0A543AMA8_9MICC|nr:universal stress protein [Enteractinococcus coprophilus]TQL73730.1 nucleotide-binding universal stress UspA family protein [Enteractinococcus coprophilus]